MSERQEYERVMARRIASLLVAGFVAIWTARLVVAASTGSGNDMTGSRQPLFDLVTLAATGLFVAVGWAIVIRQPRNTIGWRRATLELPGNRLQTITQWHAKHFRTVSAVYGYR